MTLDEAIKHAEEVAKEQEELYKVCPSSESELFYCDGTKDCKRMKNGKNKGCQKCAKEHRQLAEWLKDYKRLLEQEPYICDTCKHKGDGWDTEPCDGCCGNHSGYEPCEDAISRQAVLNRIRESIETYHNQYTTDMLNMWGLFTQFIKEMPSVRPQESIDAISREAALEKMADYVASGYADSAEDFEEYSRIICQLPSVTQKSAESEDKTE